MRQQSIEDWQVHLKYFCNVEWKIEWSMDKNELRLLAENDFEAYNIFDSKQMIYD